MNLFPILLLIKGPSCLTSKAKSIDITLLDITLGIEVTREVLAHIIKRNRYPSEEMLDVCSVVFLDVFFLMSFFSLAFNCC